MTIQPESTNPLIVAFAKTVRARWPEFLDHAAMDPDGSWKIVYPSPHRADGKPLYIQADPDFDELIIGFGPCHSHGGPWDLEGDPDYEFKGSIEFIEGILADQVVACQYPGLSRIWFLTELEAMDDWPTVLTVVSWRGTHDRG